jgi:excisionase family DNA binding protein
VGCTARNCVSNNPRACALGVEGQAQRPHQGDVVSCPTIPERSIMDDLLKVQEVADTYGVSQKTVRNWIKEGKLEARRIGGRLIRIESRSLDALNEPVHYRGYVDRRNRSAPPSYFQSFSWRDSSRPDTHPGKIIKARQPRFNHGRNE